MHCTSRREFSNLLIYLLQEKLSSSFLLLWWCWFHGYGEASVAFSAWQNGRASLRWNAGDYENWINVEPATLKRRRLFNVKATLFHCPINVKFSTVLQCTFNEYVIIGWHNANSLHASIYIAPQKTSITLLLNISVTNQPILIYKILKKFYA